MSGQCITVENIRQDAGYNGVAEAIMQPRTPTTELARRSVLCHNGNIGELAEGRENNVKGENDALSGPTIHVRTLRVNLQKVADPSRAPHRRKRAKAKVIDPHQGRRTH